MSHSHTPAAAQPIITEAPPSFMRTMMSGVKGFFKGAVAGGAVGSIAGAVMGAAALMASFSFGNAIGSLDVPFTMAAASAAGTAIFAAIGAISGTMTDIVRCRETNHFSTQDVVTVAQISYAQGLSQGLSQQQETGKSQDWDKFAKERLDQLAATTGKVLH